MTTLEDPPTRRALPPRAPGTLSDAELAASIPAVQEQIERMTDAEARALLYDWRWWARPGQRWPAGEWRLWMLRAGRGYGKTKTGAETTRDRVTHHGCRAPALVGATAADVRDVMVEGPNGILAVSPKHDRPKYEPSKRKITWPNGAIGHTYSADEPERLRGPQHDWAWCDEVSAWRFPVALDNLLLGLRIGPDPRALLTLTPKPFQWLRELNAKPSTTTTTGSTYENAPNLAPGFLQDIIDRYEGTRMGLQELHAVYLDSVEGALWTEAAINLHRVTGWVPGPEWRIVIGVDPPGETAECGIIVAAAHRSQQGIGQAFVLDDRSMAGRPEEWGAQVVSAWKRWGAETVIVESNQGGDMVRAVIQAVDAACPVRKLRATVSKQARAEPVSTAYEKGRIHHVGYLGLLESQMLTWVPDESKSPDRLDAAVHAIVELLPDLAAGYRPPSNVSSVAGIQLPPRR